MEEGQKQRELEDGGDDRRTEAERWVLEEGQKQRDGWKRDRSREMECVEEGQRDGGVEEGHKQRDGGVEEGQKQRDGGLIEGQNRCGRGTEMSWRSDRGTEAERWVEGQKQRDGVEEGQKQRAGGLIEGQKKRDGCVEGQKERWRCGRGTEERWRERTEAERWRCG